MNEESVRIRQTADEYSRLNKMGVDDYYQGCLTGMRMALMLSGQREDAEYVHGLIMQGEE